jgi:hypothetical protein
MNKKQIYNFDDEEPTLLWIPIIYIKLSSVIIVFFSLLITDVPHYTILHLKKISIACPLYGYPWVFKNAETLKIDGFYVDLLTEIVTSLGIKPDIVITPEKNLLEQVMHFHTLLSLVHVKKNIIIDINNSFCQIPHVVATFNNHKLILSAHSDSFDLMYYINLALMKYMKSKEFEYLKKKWFI